MEAAIVLKSDPFSWKALQAYKIAAALSKKVKVYFIAIKEGVYFLSSWNPQELELEDFRLYGVNKDNLTFVVDRDDFEVRALDEANLWIKEFHTLFADEKHIAHLLRKSHVVGVW